VLYSSAVGPYYIACWVGDEKVERCGHQHETIAHAETCHGDILGRFIRTVDSEGERSLNDEELEVWRSLSLKV
jgi:hypothetical protein